MTNRERKQKKPIDFEKVLLVALGVITLFLQTMLGVMPLQRENLSLEIEGLNQENRVFNLVTEIEEYRTKYRTLSDQFEHVNSLNDSLSFMHDSISAMADFDVYYLDLDHFSYREFISLRDHPGSHSHPMFSDQVIMNDLAERVFNTEPSNASSYGHPVIPDYITNYSDEHDYPELCCLNITNSSAVKANEVIITVVRIRCGGVEHLSSYSELQWVQNLFHRNYYNELSETEIAEWLDLFEYIEERYSIGSLEPGDGVQIILAMTWKNPRYFGQMPPREQEPILDEYYYIPIVITYRDNNGIEHELPIRNRMPWGSYIQAGLILHG